LSPRQASSLLVQHGRDDLIFVLPFDARVRGIYQGQGDASEQERLLAQVQREKADGGTDIYQCALEAMDLIAKVPDRSRYLAAIALMTDGRSSTGSRERFLQRWRAAGMELPVFGITFGDADQAQLDQIAEETRARVFDGTRNLREAFRTMRGYN
jgi:Ca-activated chloride channel family protein